MSTPYELMKMFSDVVNIPLRSFEGGLSRWVFQNSRRCLCPYSTFTTGVNRRFQIFVCTLGGKKRSCKTIKKKVDCKSFVKFEVELGMVNYISGDFFHNHETTPRFVHCHRSSLTEEEVKKINDLQMIGLWPGRIRSLLKLRLKPSHFYDVRRKTIKEMKKDEIEAMKCEIRSWEGYKCYYHYQKVDNRKKMVALTIINIEILQYEYSHDLAIVDDTAKLNQYDLNGESIIVMDQNGNNQLLAFGFLVNKSKEGFKVFFKDVRGFTGQPFRIIISDRSGAQTAAINEIYPESRLLFCVVHITRNVVNRFHYNNELVTMFIKLTKEIISFEVFAEFIDNKRATMKDSEISYIEDILNIKEKWVPSITKYYMIFENHSSNRVESFFGTLKSRLNNSISSMKSVMADVAEISEAYMLKQLDAQTLRKVFVPEVLLSEKDSDKIGEYALLKIVAEYNDLKSNIITKSENCRSRNEHFNIYIPCQHLIIENLSKVPVLRLDDFGSRWIQCKTNFTLYDNDYCESEYNQSEDVNYSNLQSRFQRYFSIVKNNTDVKNELLNCINKLDSLLNVTETEEPLTISQKGCIQTKISNNVLKGKQSSKKTYKCSFCKLPGHTAARCKAKLNITTTNTQ